MKLKAPKGHHYYASSVATWKVDEDLEAIIRRMKSEQFAFSVWLVPCGISEPYQIARFAPQVKGATFIATYTGD